MENKRSDIEKNTSFSDRLKLHAFKNKKIKRILSES